MKSTENPRHDYFKGHVVIIGNNPLSITDTGGALLRRVRLIKVHIAKERKDLSWSEGEWKGELVPEQGY